MSGFCFSDEKQKTYTYFVGENGVLVHNMCYAANTLTDAQKMRVNSVDNIVNKHMKEGDFTGTLADLQGNPIPNPNGGYWDHLTEMKNSYRGLVNAREGLMGSLRNPYLSDVDRQILQNSLNKANFYISKIENLFSGFGGI